MSLFTLSLFTQPETYAALAMLTALEVVLSIDNLVFLALVAGALPPADQPRARRWGLLLALLMRLGLLLTLSALMRLTQPLAEVLGRPVSGRDLILIVGGGFLVAKATWEIYAAVEPTPNAAPRQRRARSFALALVQIALLDIVFSLDSVITAIGMANALGVMVLAMVLASGVMLAFARIVGDFVQRHPSMKVLALSFLILIGVLLCAEGLGHPVPHGYVYFAMAFAFAVELVNLRSRRAYSSKQ